MPPNGKPLIRDAIIPGCTLRKNNAPFFRKQTHDDLKVREWYVRLSFARPNEHHVHHRPGQFTGFDSSYNVVHERLLFRQESAKTKIELISQFHCIERHHPLGFVEIKSVLSDCRPRRKRGQGCKKTAKSVSCKVSFSFHDSPMISELATHCCAGSVQFCSVWRQYLFCNVDYK